MITAALIAPECRGYGSPAASLFDGFPAASVSIGKKRLKEPTHPRKVGFQLPAPREPRPEENLPKVRSPSPPLSLGWRSGAGLKAKGK
jgi:hypothetical protein